MSVFRVLLAVHIAAAFLWLGHMFFWSLFGGPSLKRVEPESRAARLRELSMRLGGLGWPALAVLVITGVLMLDLRGPGVQSLLSPDLVSTTYGRALVAKLVLVGGMIGYQAWFGHRRAPRAIYFNMLAAVLVLAASTVLVGG